MNYKWHVVYTSPNSEKRIYNELTRRSINAFLPTTQADRQWSDRKKKIDVPLFPNYVFVNVPPRDMWKVLSVSGVVRYVSFGGTPAVVKETEISLIKKIISGTTPVHSGMTGLKERGVKVRVWQGPLTGVEGTVIDLKSSTRVYVELKTIHQTIAIDIDAAMLETVQVCAEESVQ